MSKRCTRDQWVRNEAEECKCRVCNARRIVAEADAAETDARVASLDVEENADLARQVLEEDESEREAG